MYITIWTHVSYIAENIGNRAIVLSPSFRPLLHTQPGVEWEAVNSMVLLPPSLSPFAATKDISHIPEKKY